MSTGTTMIGASTDVTLDYKNHWLKIQRLYFLTKDKAYGDVPKLLTHRVPIDYHQLLVDKARNHLDLYKLNLRTLLRRYLFALQKKIMKSKQRMEIGRNR